MRFHYALVDDILKQEEFDRRIEEKIASYGGAIDETAAALLVVEELGRSHQKIEAITISPSLVSFFGKVIQVTDPKEFTRDDGSTGCVSRVELADSTGSIPLVLWDEMAAGVRELEEGTVIEVIGRPKKGRITEVHALAVRETSVEITISEEKSRSFSSSADIDARILVIEPPRTFTRRDGVEVTIQEAIIGDPSGCARFITWEPALLEGISEGASVRITGAKRRSSDDGIEYIAQEGTTIIPLDEEIGFSFRKTSEVHDKGVYSVRGTITSLHPPRQFTTRRGQPSWVRNLFIDGPLRIVIWGDRACEPFLCGETIEIYNAGARLNRYGDVELSVGFGSAIRVVTDKTEERVIEGVIILTSEGMALSDGKNIYVIEPSDLRLATRYRISGRLSGRRLVVDEATPLPADSVSLKERAAALATPSLSPSGVGY
ncbi:MAG: Nucleic acid binding, OB-fold, tRNA/helicase-type [Methanomicrobiales archaeon 53_19]|uniref:OB-fold nucleic acid binding domain-containing protein n=1 Tax=Methanocalculus sp. TaxID=2004547 RepID=UPI00074818FD|nr:OB-fold nucleic acid binding domain-containing protein [Methanocalculus sp.]KUK70618.1 MAG: Nucleic acid binding, OB-fold, tRNA/helicase-type [Methanocalculus sp. 52_23]KUL03508.1 MAG: Nucleic acid binding, OB-fold, tRNA/helicase-type [Methanomicrobiales archaeon 53_19]HIJ06728.1 nucleotide-binding protein [Methanocalculus sp.]